MRFDQPCGSPQDREQHAWAGGWFDASPYAQEYNGGQYHTGADLNLNAYADTGKPVLASADGEVTYSGVLSGWNGRTVIIEHVIDANTKRWTRYSHMGPDLRVRVGQRVTRGTQLGVVGDYNPSPGGSGDHIHFDVARIDLRAKPGDWPGASRERVLRDYENPRDWINSHREEGGAITPPQFPIKVRCTAVPALNVRVAPNPGARVIGQLGTGAVAIAHAESADRRWYALHAYAGQAVVSKDINLAEPQTFWGSKEYFEVVGAVQPPPPIEPPPPPVEPPPPALVIPGKAMTKVDTSVFANTVEATLLGVLRKDSVVWLEGTAGEFVTLTVQASGEPIYQAASGAPALVKARAADFVNPVTPPPPTGTRTLSKWGLHCMYSMSTNESLGAPDIAHALGARFVNTIDIGPDGWVRQAKKYPDTTFICRLTQDRGRLPGVTELADRFGLSAAWPSNIIIVGLNEDDCGIPFSSDEGMRRRHDWDVAFYSEVMRRAPAVTYAASIYPPTDKPEEAHLASVFKETYVASFNSRPKFWLDFHNYGRDERTLWSVNAAGEQETLFFEMRLAFVLRHGAQIAAANNRCIYSESGIDKMGVGGVNQLGLSQQDWLVWLRRYDDLHREYGLDALVAGGTFYQFGDSYPQPIGRTLPPPSSGGWWGYELYGYRDTMATFYGGGK